MALLKQLSLLLLIILSFSIVDRDFSKYPNVVCKSYCPYFTSNPPYFNVDDEVSQAQNFTSFLFSSQNIAQLVKQLRFYRADFKQKHIMTLLGVQNLQGYKSEIQAKFGVVDIDVSNACTPRQDKVNLRTLLNQINPARQLLQIEKLLDCIDDELSSKPVIHLPISLFPDLRPQQDIQATPFPTDRGDVAIDINEAQSRAEEEACYTHFWNEYDEYFRPEQTLQLRGNSSNALQWWNDRGRNMLADEEKIGFSNLLLASLFGTNLTDIFYNCQKSIYIATC